MTTRLYFKYHNGEQETYEAICLGRLYGRDFSRLAEVTFPFGEFLHGRIPFTYLNFLRDMGFEGFSDTEYRVSIVAPFYYPVWLSTFIVLRYTYEATAFIDTWAQVYHARQDLNPWIVFLALHHGYTYINAEHGLLPPHFEEAVQPQLILNNMKQQHTGFQAQRIEIHRLWGGTRYLDAVEDNRYLYLDVYEWLMPIYTRLSANQTTRTSWP